MVSHRSRGGLAPSGLDPSAHKLCAQAHDALALAFADAGDARLDHAVLRAVVPHPDGSCLLVVVAAPAHDVEAVRAALDHARGYLRREVAAEIHRKRAPELAFSVVPSDLDSPEGA